ncbi:MAG TPA: carbohydrate-binding protein [Clostridia bacterium]
MGIKLKKAIGTVACAVALSMSFIIPIQTNGATGDATVNLSSTKQIMRGFGTCTAWNGALSDKEMDILYKDMGLNILRLRIDPNKGWSDELSNAKKAQARGAIVFATPWTPPASMKTNNNTVGGSLKTSEYANYAKYLKSYCDYMSSNGAPLYAISLQNEPNITVTYESCTWTGQQFCDFLKNNGSLIGNTKIMMPEAFNFDFSLSDPTLNDATASSYVSIVGGHLYGAQIKDYALAHTKGKEVWMTEYYDDGQDVTSALKTAKQIHDCLTVANMNAYIWWWVHDDNMGFINKAGAPQKRGYAVGQFSKFIKNGYNRVDATANPKSNVYVTAYKGDDNKVVIVAINQGTSAVSQNFVLQNGTTSKVSEWVTDGSRNIAAGSDINVTNGSFTATLPAQSVTTFVGSTSTTSPTPTPPPTPTPGPQSAFTQIEAEDFNDQSGIQTETCSEGGQDVGYIEDGDYAVYNNINFGSGAASFEARVSSAASGGNIEIRLDSSSGPLVGTCPVTETGDWQTWANATCNVSGVSGIHDLYLKFTGGSGYLFNLNWWKFSPGKPGLMGDVDGDGKVNSADVSIEKRIILGTYTGDTSHGDVNGDGKINSTDYSIVKRIVLGIYTAS